MKERNIPAVAQMVKNLPAVQETWVQTLGWEDPLQKGMLFIPVLLPGEFHRLEESGRLQATIHGVTKSHTQLSN